jgi:hypothetical protein
MAAKRTAVCLQTAKICPSRPGVRFFSERDYSNCSFERQPILTFALHFQSLEKRLRGFVGWDP